jgi:hypothetical protein
MQTKLEQLSAKNPNPVLSVVKDGTVLYSNEAGEPLLHEWGVEIGKKLPFYLEDLVKKAISRNSQEKKEVYIRGHLHPQEWLVRTYHCWVSYLRPGEHWRHSLCYRRHREKKGRRNPIKS